jgi:hypothetical protein
MPVGEQKFHRAIFRFIILLFNDDKWVNFFLLNLVCMGHITMIQLADVYVQAKDCLGIYINGTKVKEELPE